MNIKKRVENVILVTLDGVRTQEMFGGLDFDLLKQLWQSKFPNSRVETSELYNMYWAHTEQQRREKLMPWFWTEFMTNHGAIIGDRNKGSVMTLSNRFRFSYPGYSEILTGCAYDDVINSNDFGQNIFQTICEYIKEHFKLDKTQVAVFASWNTLAKIAEKEMGAVTTNAGPASYTLVSDPLVPTLNDLQFHTKTPFPDLRHDIYTFHFAMNHLKSFRPKFLFLGLGETDDWAHENRYDLYLDALKRTDGYLKQLFDFVQSNEHYKDKTAILITTDHGRGDSIADWHDHESDIEGAQYVWLAIYSPYSKLRGNQVQSQNGDKGFTQIKSSQIAATILNMLGIDHNMYNAKVGDPLQAFL